MSYITLNNVDVTFAIYNAKMRSVRNRLMQSVGCKVNSIDNVICVKSLDNISLHINQGERIGLIGHNGAGKTTLLRVLSKIYEPTSGSIEIQGSISSLTDITMGMDPENTGYDNIIMRLVFMGLTFKEAKSKVKEIIDFAEMSEYVYLPMRVYSTGMYLRLAFAIATSIIPDILIMDEIISAGDACFIEKAAHRSKQLIKNTDIMVISSHDMQILSDICTRGILMQKGRIIMDGNIKDVIKAYHDSISAN